MKGALLQLADFPAASSLVRLFFTRADAQGDRPFLGRKHGAEWTTLSWAEAADQVCLLAQALRDLDLATGDRVLIVSENRPEWCIADIAIMAAGLVTTPAYITNTTADHAHILADSGARAVIAMNAAIAVILAMLSRGLRTHDFLPQDRSPMVRRSGADCPERV